MYIYKYTYITVLQAGATKYAAVATAVYRTSKNGAEFISELSRNVGVRIQVVDQDMEGALGYYTAASLAPPGPGPLLAWEIGIAHV